MIEGFDKGLTRRGEKMYWIQFVTAETGLSVRLEDTVEQYRVRLHIQLAQVFQSFHPKHVPDPTNMIVILL